MFSSITVLLQISPVENAHPESLLHFDSFVFFCHKENIPPLMSKIKFIFSLNYFILRTSGLGGFEAKKGEEKVHAGSTGCPQKKHTCSLAANWQWNVTYPQTLKFELWITRYFWRSQSLFTRKPTRLYECLALVLKVPDHPSQHIKMNHRITDVAYV